MVEGAFGDVTEPGAAIGVKGGTDFGDGVF